MDWWCKYLGQPYARGNECTRFIARIMAEEFGIDLPQWSPPKSQRACDCAEHNLRERMLGEMVNADPQSGDCVVMKSTMGRRLTGWHVGIYVAASRPSVLHITQATGSVLTPLRRLEQLLLTVEGIYRWAHL